MMVVIPFYPLLVKYTKTIHSALLLAQILYWYRKMGRRFYKFKMPCELSKSNKSKPWTEEIPMTRHQFDSALKNIATPIKKGKVYNLLTDCNMVLYYMGNGYTYYLPNYPKIVQVLEAEEAFIRQSYPEIQKWKTRNPIVEIWDRSIPFSEIIKLDFSTPLLIKSNHERTQKNTKKRNFKSFKKEGGITKILSKYEE